GSWAGRWTGRTSTGGRGPWSRSTWTRSRSEPDSSNGAPEVGLRRRSVASPQGGSQPARRARALRRLRERRSSSDRPPQTPESWPDSRANLRHAVMTSHFWHTAFASWICVIAGPVFPIGKNSSGSWLRHSARWRQSIVTLSFQDATPRPVGRDAARVAPSGAFSGLRLGAAGSGAGVLREVRRRREPFSILWGRRGLDKGLDAQAWWHFPHTSVRSRGCRDAGHEDVAAGGRKCLSSGRQLCDEGG